MTVTASREAAEKSRSIRLAIGGALNYLRRNELKLLGALFLAGTMAKGAIAAEAKLGDVSVTLPPPAGFCELSANHLADSRGIASVSQALEKSGSKLLSESAACDQLADWRVGRRALLDDYAMYHTLITLLDKPASGSLAHACNTARTRGYTAFPKQWPDMKARIESAWQNVKVDKPSDLGVLDEDANACYSGFIEKLPTQAGTDKNVLGLGAMTTVRNRFMYFWRYTVYRNPDTVDTLLAKQKIDVVALIAANP